MLACARIGAVHNVVFGGFSPESVRERMEFSEAKALITVDGARRKGRTAPIKAAVDEVMPDLPCIVVRHTGIDAPMADKDAWFDELMEAAGAECPAEPLDAEHPLFILYTSGSTAKPKGILHTTGGYLTHVAYTHKAVFDLKPDEDVYWCSADVGWVTGHSYIVYGPLANGATSVMYEGAPDYPDKDIWWELCARYGVTIFYTAPTAIRACMKWGAEYPERHDLLEAAAARDGRRADQPEGVALVPQGDRRRALPDRRHLVADRDRRDHDHDAAGRARRPSRARPARPLPGVKAAWSTTTARTPAPSRASSRSTGRGRGCCGRSTRRTTASSRRTGRSSARRPTSVGDAARRDEDGYFWIIGRDRRRAQRLRPPDVDGGDRVGDRLLLAGRRGGGDRAGRRGHGPVGDRVRDARGRATRAPTS